MVGEEAGKGEGEEAKGDAENKPVEGVEQAGERSGERRTGLDRGGEGRG